MLLKICDEIESCLRNENYIAALTLALTIPDICGKAEFSNYSGSKKKYISWYDSHFHMIYLKEEQKDFPIIDGSIIYDLRCQMLHFGNPGINDKSKFCNFVIEYGKDKTRDGSRMNVTKRTDTGEMKFTYYFNLNEFCVNMVSMARYSYENNSEKYNFFNYRFINHDNPTEVEV